MAIADSTHPRKIASSEKGTAGLPNPDERPINTVVGDTRFRSEPQMAGSGRRHTGLHNPDSKHSQMGADRCKHATELPNPDDILESEATKTRLKAAPMIAGDGRRHTGLPNPPIHCFDGGPDHHFNLKEGPSQKDLKAPRLPQRLHEHPDGSRMHPGGDASPIKE